MDRYSEFLVRTNRKVFPDVVPFARSESPKAAVERTWVCGIKTLHDGEFAPSIKQVVKSAGNNTINVHISDQISFFGTNLFLPAAIEHSYSGQTTR